MAPNRRRVLLLIVGGLVVAVLLFWLSFRLASSDATATETPTTGLSPAAFAQTTGLEIVRLTLAAGDGMLDLRYRVVDAHRASGHGAHGHSSSIREARTGTVLSDQWMGGMHRMGQLSSGATYYTLFLNPRGLVRRGDKVAVHVGDARLDGVTVQ